MTPMQIALKVDVDTRAGVAEGVPRLRRMLGERGIPATFFITFGPDNSGKAIRRIFRPGFVAKMVRTRAVRMYGWKTMLYGTLLPAPPVGTDFPELLRGLAADGHEVGLHAWDHVYWHDMLARMTPAEVASEFGRGIDAFKAVFAAPPRACAAPGWTATATSLQVQDGYDLLYHSDARGTAPFLPVMDDYAGRTPRSPPRCRRSTRFLARPTWASPLPRNTSWEESARGSSTSSPSTPRPRGWGTRISSRGF